MIAKQTHYFIAIKVHNEIIHEIVNNLSELQINFPFQKWVHPLDYHLTLAFLGGVAKDKLKELQQILGEHIKGSLEFSLHINHLGVFGNKDKPRIFWAGLEENQQLHHLRNMVYEACLSLGLSLEVRPFHPHITLARKWGAEECLKPTTLENNPFNKSPLNMKVSSIQLFQINLNQEPKYEVINSYTFADNH